MPNSDLFLQTIEAVYASALDGERLPEVLESTSRLLGAAGACFEIIDKSTCRQDLFVTVGAPSVARTPYLEEFMALNPRIPFALRQPVGSVS
jgi:hypothetical protein